MTDQLQQPDEKTVKTAVQERYGAIARGEVKSCCSTSPSGRGDSYSTATMAQGYSASELAVLPEGANLGLGCGDPTADADLLPGQTVLDLGSGAGVDCFLAARKVGPGGRVIGVDMTDDMLAKARANAQRGGFSNVEFRKGDIENLPVDAGTVDRVISNCVINLAPDKARVFAEIYRVLKPGGAVTVSDIVSSGKIPPAIRADMERWAGCTAGALEKDAYLAVVRAAGFSEVGVLKEVAYEYLRTTEYALASLTVRAVK
jgi:arsenite methyltransferase